MNNLMEVLNLQILMFTVMGIGWYLRRKEIIRVEDKRILTDLIIDLILPCNIIASFCMEMPQNIMVEGVLILVVSCVIQLVCCLISKVLYNRYPQNERMVLQYGTICSNAGFLGNPIAEGFYGAQGLLYAAIFMIPQRIVMWSVGVAYFTESPNIKALLKKIVVHPCIVSVFVGLGIMTFNLKLPYNLVHTIDTIGSSTTVMTMLLIGAILAEADIRSLLTVTTCKFAILRLLLLPLLTFFCCKILQLPEIIGGLAVILVAMPAGTTTVILASKYKGNEEFATKCVVLTTLLSLGIIPSWYMFIQYFYV